MALAPASLDVPSQAGENESVPVYLLTAHAYLSWREDDPLGYVQRREGLREPSVALARDRLQRARHPEVRFERAMQVLLHRVCAEIALERKVTLHAQATCPTHVHVLVSFRSPACTCGAVNHCARDCDARQFADQTMARMKRKMGQALAEHGATRNRPWFSRGWDRTKVSGNEHFTHLIATYLPDHGNAQGKIFRRYGA
jgi:hypothetical protein